jgi:hypothetical protein
LEFLHVRVHVEIHISNSLNFGDQLAFLGEQFRVFLDGSHMGGKNFLLFFENVGDFLLEGEVVLSDIVVLQSRLHDIHVFFNFLLVNSVNF